MLAALIKGRFLGHPIHSMLVHFPSALFPTAWFFDIVSIITKHSLYSLIAFYMLGLGVIAGILAASFGAMDYMLLSPKHPGWKKASIHACLNIIWLIIFGTIFGVNMMDYPNIKIISLSQMIILSFSVLGLIFSNFLGGELVFRHRVGIIEDHINN